MKAGGNKPFLVAILAIGSIGFEFAHANSVRANEGRGEVFQDCKQICPKMIALPPGEVTMQTKDSRAINSDKRHVTISYAFAVGVYDITVSEFSAFVRETGYRSGDSCYTLGDDGWQSRKGLNWRRPGFTQTDRNPVVCINYDDTQAYVHWLTRKTGYSYRLLSESEWEYAAKASARSIRYWEDGAADACSYANIADLSEKLKFPRWKAENCSDGYVYSSPVGSFRPNAFGLYDMVGNVWQFVEDCYFPDYAEEPTDGSPRRDFACSSQILKGGRVMRGGSWNSYPWETCSADRCWNISGNRYYDDGFRVARSITRSPR